MGVGATRVRMGIGRAGLLAADFFDRLLLMLRVGEAKLMLLQGPLTRAVVSIGGLGRPRVLMHVVVRGRCGFLHLLLLLGVLLTWLGSDSSAARLDDLVDLRQLVDITVSLFGGLGLTPIGIFLQGCRVDLLKIAAYLLIAVQAQLLHLSKK